MIEYALAYAERGYKVFPLHTPDAEGRCSCHKDCGSVGKHPRTMDGLKSATDNADQIRKWWGMWEDANIGLATGAVSGVFVVDVDPRHGGDVTLKALAEKHGLLSEKRYVKTGGGGWHLYFLHPGFAVKSRANALGPGVDVKGEGGYVVAPPSLHASGQTYDWGGEYSGVLPAPPWLHALVPTPDVQTPSAKEGADISDGGRNQTLTSMAGAMRRRGMSEDAIYAALSVENENRCRPPLEESEVRKIAHSVARYSPEDPAYIYPEQVRTEGERPDGVFFVSEFADEIRELYEQGMTGGLTTGILKLDWHYTVKAGQWTVVTGIPGHGKSALLDCILYNLANLHGWKIAVTSIENQPLKRHAAQLMSLWAGEPFGKCDTGRMSRETREAALKWLDEHFVFILPDEGGCSVNGILERVSWADSQGFFTNGVVIDPWNELEHRRPANMTETEYVSHSLTRMRHFARTREKHLWLVAHPTKLAKDVKTGNYPVPTLYDISGSAHFRNKADFGLSVWRDVLNENTPTQIHVQKVRFRECGKPGMVELYFDVRNGRYGEERPDYFAHYARQEEGVTW